MKAAVLLLWLILAQAAWADTVIEPATAPSRYAAGNPAPAYPEQSLRRGEQGTVALRVRVGRSGQTEEIRLHRSSGYPLLDRSAIEIVKQWRFTPTRRDGVPIEEWVEVPIVFKLEEPPSTH